MINIIVIKSYTDKLGKKEKKTYPKRAMKGVSHWLYMLTR